MRLEDALFQLQLDCGRLRPGDAADLAAEAIGSGVDMLCLHGVGEEHREVAASVGEACRREDAIFVTGPDPALSAELGADGVLLPTDGMSLGQARVMAGPGAIVGLTTRSRDEVLLAVTLSADYVVHTAGTRCRTDFDALGGQGSTHLYAGGITGLSDAKSIVSDGFFRLSIDLSILDVSRLSAGLADYAQILGRSM